jgi:hypothetical protein
MDMNALITREFREAFQRVDFERWNALIAEDVLINSPGHRARRAGRRMKADG